MNVFSQSLLIEANPSNIRYIDNPSDDIIQMAIEKMPELIKEYKNNEIKFQKIAVLNDGLAIQYLKDPVDEVIEIALSQNGLAIQYIHESKITKKNIEIALSQNGLAIKFIKKIYLTDDLIEIALENNGKSIMYIDKQLDNFKIKAVKNNGKALEFIKNPSQEIINLAIEKDPFSIIFISNPSIENIKKAIDININVINLIQIDSNIQEYLVDKLFSNNFQFYTSNIIKSNNNDFDYYKFEKFLRILVCKNEIKSNILHKIELQLIEKKIHNNLFLIEIIKKHNNYNSNMAEIIFDYFGN